MNKPRNGVYRGLCLFFFMILHLQNLLISNLPGAKLASLGNLRYQHFKIKSWKIMF